MAAAGDADGAPAVRRLGATVERIADVIPNADYPPAWPFLPEHFARVDEDEDSVFYVLPRLVHHIDDAARFALREFYAELFGAREKEARERAAGDVDEEGLVVLDLASSWESHYPEEGVHMRRVVGLGMNAAELSRNGTLSEFVTQDLNAGDALCELPFEDSTFDVVTCTVSVDYLIRPREVLREVLRVLRPGGSVALAFSNRMFPSKAIAAWRAGNDADRVWLAGAFLHYARIPGWRFSARELAAGRPAAGDEPSALAWDLSPSSAEICDPLFVVVAHKVPE